MTSGTPILPPLDYSITLPETLAFHEKHNAEHPVYVFSKDGAEGYTEISYGQFGRSSRRVPRLLGIEIDPLTKPVVAIMAQTDTLIYHTITLGLMRAGAIPFPISPRNTAAAVVNLLKKTSCHHLVATCTTLKEVLESVKTELAAQDSTYVLSILEAPVLGQLYPELSNDPASHDVDSLDDPPIEFKPVLDDVCIYLHSSGSTGLPKAIPRTYRESVDYVRFPTCTVYRGHTSRVKMATLELPPFHAMGFVMQVSVPFFSCSVVAIFPPVVENPKGVPILASPQTVIDHMEKTKATSTFSIPAFLHVWAHDKRAVKILSNLDFVAFGGGALNPQVADLLVENGLKLRIVYGGTEFGVAGLSSQREGDEADWEYMEINGCSNPQFVPQGDGTHELQFVSLDEHPRSVVNMPGVKGYATSDLFIRHPTKDHLWKIVGRLDDVIIHSSGEKTVPPPLEDAMLGSPYIQGVVMFGAGRDQPGVLIEPRPAYAIDVDDITQVAQFRNLVWSAVEEANKLAPAFSKIFKELILVASKTKPLPRTPKGTVFRKPSLTLYAAEIDAIYANVDSTLATDLIAAPTAWHKGSVSAWILDQAHELCPGKTISTSSNLFEQGFDSLSATILRRRITGALNSVKNDNTPAALALISQNTIYNYPTIDSLSELLATAMTDPQAVGTSKSHVEVLEEMITKYSFNGHINGTNDHANGLKNEQGGNTVVLITGTTGYLGSQVLEALLRDSSVSKVYTLNRTSRDAGSSADRHLKRFHDKGLDEGLLTSSKLVHIESDYAEENLGIPQATYEELLASVNVVIHIAWRLDFNLSLASFESNVRGTHNLAALARASPHAAGIKFIFTSSVGVAQSWDQAVGPYPEELLLDPKYAVGSGYGESKYITERILATSGLNATSVRIGQITGTETNGAWATSDWVPILVKSSLAMQALPSADGNISWLSSNAVAGTILDLMAYDGHYPQALNIVHPNCITWNSVLGYIQEALQKERNVSIPLIPFQKWCAILEKHASLPTNEVMLKMPAIKLHNFFNQLLQGDLAASSHTTQAFGSVEFATEKTRGISKTLANLVPLTQDHPSKWIKYWNNEGLFD